MTGRYEEKFTKEMDELRVRHARELELAKGNLEDIHAARIAHLKDLKEELEARVLKLESSLRDKTAESEDTLVLYKTLQSKFNDEMSALRLQVRMKVD